MFHVIMDSNTPINYQTSPRRIATSMLNQQFLASSKRESSLALVKQELQNKIVYDDPSVFQRLGIHNHHPQPSNFVQACAASVEINCADMIESLKKTCGRADGRDETVLEKEEKLDNVEEKTSGNHGTKEEKEMYPPLVGFQLYTE